MKKMIFTVLLAAIATAAVFADVAEPKHTPKAPKPNKSIDTHMMIKLDSDAEKARLIIPKSQVQQLRAALEDLDTGDDTLATAGYSRTSTIVSGMFLSLAIAFGGIWFVRSGRAVSKTARTAAMIAAVAAIGAAATIVYGNVGPPPQARVITGKMFTEAVHRYKFGSGDIKLEVSADATEVTLIVPDPLPSTRDSE